MWLRRLAAILRGVCAAAQLSCRSAAQVSLLNSVHLYTIGGAYTFTITSIHEVVKDFTLELAKDRMTSRIRLDAPHSSNAPAELPFSLVLELNVQDPETITDLTALPEGDEREQFALKALRIGLLALRQARGQIDGETVRREGERLLAGVQSQLNEHSSIVHERLNIVLKEYFDPTSGRFQERIDRLIQRDGELEQTLRRQIGRGDSELCRTLTAHVGNESPLLKLLSPKQSEGLLAAMRGTFDEQLTQQREQLLGQFSLDNREGALSRFITELNQQQGKMTDRLQHKMDEVISEFSLDQEDSALSRLVRNVDRAQRTITSEFSLDEETSALSRLKRMLESTNAAIHAHLSLDNDDSALTRLKRELMRLLIEQRETNQQFQQEVKTAIHSMQARRQEADRSTRHGLDFEDALFQWLQRAAQDAGDVARHTGNSTGLIKNCKVGDCVLSLGPETAAPGTLIVVEAKERAGYDLAQARQEIETARKNRAAQIGLFVFSKKSSPEGIDPLSRYGPDVFVVWDSEDPSSDLFLRTGVTLCRALCVRDQRRAATPLADLSVFDQAILEIEKRGSGLGDIEKWAQTIQKRSEDILQRVNTTRKSLGKQAGILTEHLDQLRESLESDRGPTDAPE